MVKRSATLQEPRPRRVKPWPWEIAGRPQSIKSAVQRWNSDPLYEPVRPRIQRDSTARGWPHEDGGSADSVPEISSHRCRLLPPSDMNGPPFFRNVLGAANRRPLIRIYPAGYACQGSIPGFFPRFLWRTPQRKRRNYSIAFDESEAKSRPSKGRSTRKPNALKCCTTSPPAVARWTL